MFAKVGTRAAPVASDGLVRARKDISRARDRQVWRMEGVRQLSSTSQAHCRRRTRSVSTYRNGAIYRQPHPRPETMWRCRPRFQRMFRLVNLVERKPVHAKRSGGGPLLQRLSVSALVAIDQLHPQVPARPDALPNQLPATRVEKCYLRCERQGSCLLQSSTALKRHTHGASGQHRVACAPRRTQHKHVQPAHVRFHIARWHILRRRLHSCSGAQVLGPVCLRYEALSHLDAASELPCSRAARRQGMPGLDVSVRRRL